MLTPQGRANALLSVRVEFNKIQAEFSQYKTRKCSHLRGGQTPCCRCEWNSTKYKKNLPVIKLPMLIENVLKLYASGACKYLAGSANKKSKEYCKLASSTILPQHTPHRNIQFCAGAANPVRALQTKSTEILED